MLKLLLVFFAVAAGLSEEQEAGAETTKNEVLSALEKIGAADATRKILLRSAVKTVAGLGATISPSQDDKLYNVSVLLGQLLQQFASEVSAREDYLDELSAELEDCDNQNQQTIENASNNANSKGDDHEACIVAHYALYQTKITKHHNLRTWQLRVSNPGQYQPTVSYTQTIAGQTVHEDLTLADACQVPEADEEKIIGGNWEVFLEATHSWFTTYKDEFINVANAYTTAAVSENDKKSECDTAQELYEEAVCGMNLTYATICGERESCFNTKKNSATNTLDDFETDNTNVPDLVRLIRYIQCIIGEIRKNDTDTTANARTFCGNIMDESPDASNSNYTEYFINTTLLDGIRNRNPSDCDTQMADDMENYLPFTYKAGESTSYRNLTDGNNNFNDTQDWEDANDIYHANDTSDDDYWAYLMGGKVVDCMWDCTGGPRGLRDDCDAVST